MKNKLCRNAALACSSAWAPTKAGAKAKWRGARGHRSLNLRVESDEPLQNGPLNLALSRGRPLELENNANIRTSWQELSISCSKSLPFFLPPPLFSAQKQQRLVNSSGYMWPGLAGLNTIILTAKILPNSNFVFWNQVFSASSLPWCLLFFFYFYLNCRFVQQHHLWGQVPAFSETYCLKYLGWSDH